MNINNAHTFAGQRYSTEKFVEDLLNLPQQFDQLIGKDQKIQQELIPVNWDSTTEFSKYEVVIYGSKFYYSKANNNKNKNPQTQKTYWGDFAQLLQSNLFFEFNDSNIDSNGILTLNTTNAIIGIVDNEGMFWNLANETVYYLENQIKIDISGILALKNIISVNGTWKALMSGINQEGFVFAEEDPIYNSDKPNIVFKQSIKAQIINFPTLVSDGSYKSYTFNGIYDIEILDEDGNIVQPDVYQKKISTNKTIIKFKNQSVGNFVNYKIIVKKIVM